MRGPLSHAAGLALAVLAATAPVSAQYGHPLKGSWTGDWYSATGKQTHVLVEMKWDGKAITGTVNPGPHAIPISKATLGPVDWRVHLEADGTDAAGKTVRYVMDGTLENIGSYNRVVSGTWTEGSAKGPITLMRN
jgi:hypothetical protein